MTTAGIVRIDRPLGGLRSVVSGPATLAAPISGHLSRLGVDVQVTPGVGATELTMTGAGCGAQHAAVGWGSLADEATVQAATGMMAVHGRRDGVPRGLAVDFASTAAAVLTTQGLFAGLLGQLRGGPSQQVEVGVDRAGLLAVSQYLAAAGAEEPEAVEIAAGGPPFTTGDGVVFELETLDPAAWAGFWRELAAPSDAVRSGWRPFQFRYAAACAPFPDSLHNCVSASSWRQVQAAATISGAEVCRLRSLTEWADESVESAAWTLTPQGSGDYRPRASSAELPLSGLKVLEAGRRIQAPLAAHLLGLLGAEVTRIEPPGGDPLRGMPPACSGLSARWLALNRGKNAVEVDIKSPSGRDRLRELAADADVFLHNWAPGKAAELSLDADNLAAVNPALVYAYTGGWVGGGHDVPMGTDFMVQARTGVGEAARPQDEPPAPSLMTLLDVLGGLLGTEAVLAALVTRERTGYGVRVESSLLAAAELLVGPAVRRIRRGENPRRPPGFRRPLRTADGWITLADAPAAAKPQLDLRESSTEDALTTLRSAGLTATRTTTDLTALEHDPRFAGTISRDAHGALAVPDPWSFS